VLLLYTECVTMVLCVLALAVAASGGESAATSQKPAGRIPLDRCSILVDEDLPTYLAYRLEDLKGYLQEITGSRVEAVREVPRAPGTVIAVGAQAVRKAVGEPVGAAALADQGFILRSAERDGRTYLLAAGGTPRGTANALAALMRLIRADGKKAFVSGALDIVSKPSFRIRGMHLNGWSFNYPYAFRRWKEQDWKNYIDLLSYQQVNLLYIWPFMEIIPLPISRQDAAYLREVRRVVDYAQKRHGMEVWIMQAVNRVARDDCGETDPRRRPYWRPSQEDLNPGDPAQFARITASHEQLYRIVNNVDGVCFIDCDPGGWPGSPVSELMSVLQHARSCLDRYNVHGRNAKVVHWLWGSWGQAFAEEAVRERVMKQTIRAMKDELPEPWEIICGTPGYLPLCKDEGVLDKTVYLPYATIEGEPSYPGTNLGLEAVGHSFDGLQDYPDLLGVMGNAQCPLLQFPRIYHYLDAAWDVDSRLRPEEDVIRELSELLYPGQIELITDCFQALDETDIHKLESLCRRLAGVITNNKLGRPGLFGRKLFPNREFVAESLLLQVRLRLALECLCQKLEPSSGARECQRLVVQCLDAYLAWDEAHGWHDLWGGGSWTFGRFGGDPQFQKAVHNVRRILRDDSSVAAFFDEVTRKLIGKHEPAHVRENAVEPIRAAVLAYVIIAPNLAQDAAATASTVPNPKSYPPRFANDGDISTLYWPGALTSDNSEWLQLTWDRPRTFGTVVAYFLRHDSMWKRTIHLQKEERPREWVDIAEAAPSDSGAYAVARFELPSSVTLDRIRVLNLLDLFEIEVR